MHCIRVTSLPDGSLTPRLPLFCLCLQTGDSGWKRKKAVLLVQTVGNAVDRQIQASLENQAEFLTRMLVIALGTAAWGYDGQSGVQFFVRDLEREADGFFKVINMSSILGTVGLPNQLAYASSKGGLTR